MLHLYLIRHGQTEWNTQRRFQGWLDSPLTQLGIDAALSLKEELKDILFDTYMSSPSPRAYKTLSLVSNASEDVLKTDSRLREIMLGSWQGMTHDEIETLYPEHIAMFYDEPEKFAFSNAETFYDVYDRVKSFISDLEALDVADEEKNILVVTHGVTLMVFQLIFNGESVADLNRYRVAGNVEVHKYHCHNKTWSERPYKK